MAARVRLKLARIQPHVTGASIHFILQAARPLLDLPPRFTLGAAASLTRPRASWIEWRGHAERHGDEGEGGTGRLRQRWSLRQYTRLPHSAIASLRNRRGARAWCALPAERTPQRCEEALLSTHAAGLGALGYQRSTCVYSGCTCRPLPSMGGPRPLALL